MNLPAAFFALALLILGLWLVPPAVSFGVQFPAKSQDRLHAPLVRKDVTVRTREVDA